MINKCNYKLTFSDTLLEKSNNYVFSADEIYFPADKSFKHSTVRSLVAVIRLIGNADNWHSPLINIIYECTWKANSVFFNSGDKYRLMVIQIFR
jgi:hypothetical protein